MLNNVLGVSKHLRFSIVYNGTTRCSGGCLYCCAGTNMNYTMGVNTSSLETALKDVLRVDDLTYEQFNADFNKLENTLDNDPRLKEWIKIKDNNKLLTFDIWGADPVTCFKCLQEVVPFVKEYCNKRKYKYSISTSTNGLPLLRDDVTEYIEKEKIHVQLSHDGLGQYIRTRELDPLDFPNVRKLMRLGLMTSINATLHFWNYSLFNNINYFNEKLKEIFPEVYSETEIASEELSRAWRSLYIKLNHIYDGQYDIKGKNYAGKFNGKIYESLKEEKLGDLAFHNDYELAKKHNIPELAHVLDDYIQEWFTVLRNRGYYSNNMMFIPYLKYIDEQLNRYGFLKEFNSPGNMCRNYQIGLTPYSEHLDTKGNYSDCNLIDSDNSVANRSNVREEICKDCKTCKYKMSKECNMCGSLLPREKCEYYYRWNQFLEFCYYAKQSNGPRSSATKR